MSALRPHRRALLAAARLAAIYTAGVVVMLLPPFVAASDRAELLDILRWLSAGAGVLLALAFVALAVARRFGFALLWLLLLGLWGLDARAAVSSEAVPHAALFLGTAFFRWTIFAAPLLAMQALGTPPRSAPLPRWRRRAALAGVALWMAGAVAGFLGPHTSYTPAVLGPAAQLIPMSLVWLPGPLVVTALALSELRRLKPQPNESVAAE